MYTAQMARQDQTRDFDKELAKIVDDARPSRTAYVPVFWHEYGYSMAAHADYVVKMLEERGFHDVEVRDLDSLRFAEVHFSW